MHVSTLMRFLSNCSLHRQSVVRYLLFCPDPIKSRNIWEKSRQDKSTWHVMVSLLESSPPTFFDSQLIVDALPPFVPDSIQTTRLREARSTFPLPRDGWYQSRSSMYDCGHDGRIQSRPSRSRNVRTSRTDRSSSSPAHPLRDSPSSPQSSTTRPPSISIRLRSDKRKLGRRVRPGEPLGAQPDSTAIAAVLKNLIQNTRSN